MTLLAALAPLRDRRAGLLSGGEQQMLAVARAIVASPKVLMVDEMALAVADRAYVMNHGEIVLSGAGAELAGRRDLLEASYLGDTVLPDEPTDVEPEP